MPAERIDGVAIAARVRARVAEETASLVARGVTPGLTVVLVGDFGGGTSDFSILRFSPDGPRRVTPLGRMGRAEEIADVIADELPDRPDLMLIDGGLGQLTVTKAQKQSPQGVRRTKPLRP